MQTKEELIQFIGERLDNAEKFMFISKEKDPNDENKVRICLLSQSEMDAVMCVTHWLKDKPHFLQMINEAIEKFKDEKK